MFPELLLQSALNLAPLPALATAAPPFRFLDPIAYVQPGPESGTAHLMLRLDSATSAFRAAPGFQNSRTSPCPHRLPRRSIDGHRRDAGGPDKTRTWRLDLIVDGTFTRAAASIRHDPVGGAGMELGLPFEHPAVGRFQVGHHGPGARVELEHRPLHRLSDLAVIASKLWDRPERNAVRGVFEVTARPQAVPLRWCGPCALSGRFTDGSGRHRPGRQPAQHSVYLRHTGLRGLRQRSREVRGHSRSHRRESPTGSR